MRDYGLVERGVPNRGVRWVVGVGDEARDCGVDGVPVKVVATDQTASYEALGPAGDVG